MEAGALTHRDAQSAKFARLCAIVDEHDRRPARLVPILQAVQEEYRYLPEEVLTFVATALQVPASRVFGVATFYAHFALEPKGRHVIRLCDGTACHVKHSLPILAALREHLGVDERRPTTRDMLFTVETVACLGACGLAPVLVIDDEIHGQVTPEIALKLVEEIKCQEGSHV